MLALDRSTTLQQNTVHEHNVVVSEKMTNNWDNCRQLPTNRISYRKRIIINFQWIHGLMSKNERIELPDELGDLKTLKGA